MTRSSERANAGQIRSTPQPERNVEAAAQPTLAEAIFETVREPLLVLDANRRVQRANRAFYRDFGVEEDETIGRGLAELGNGQWDIPGLRKLLDDVLDEGAVFEDFEVMHRFERLGPRTMILNARRVDRPSGHEPVTLLAIEDVTRKRRAEAERERTARELERSNADLQQFAYIASHDLQEPLRAIAGHLHLLEKRIGDELPAQAEHHIERALLGADRMQALVQDLLGYSRAGRRELHLEPVELDELVDTVLGDLEVVLEEGGATVTRGDLPAVAADRGQLAQVLRNLISNAIKFRSEEPPRMSITAKTERDAVAVSVGDNGIGIDPEYHDRIFDIFQRLHTREEVGGTGIGLALCRRIVERHGGDIVVRSTGRDGSTFTFTLPPAGRDPT